MFMNTTIINEIEMDTSSTIQIFCINFVVVVVWKNIKKSLTVINVTTYPIRCRASDYCLYTWVFQWQTSSYV